MAILHFKRLFENESADVRALRQLFAPAVVAMLSGINVGYRVEADWRDHQVTISGQKTLEREVNDWSHRRISLIQLQITKVNFRHQYSEIACQIKKLQRNS